MWVLTGSLVKLGHLDLGVSDPGGKGSHPSRGDGLQERSRSLSEHLQRASVVGVMGDFEVDEEVEESRMARRKED